VSAPEIVCVSANPAIDRRLRFRSFSVGRINRAKSVEAFAGGKAAHVAIAAHALGARTLWLGFLGGATGEEFASNFRELAIRLASIRVRISTRMNLELLEDSGKITEVLEPGEQPEPAELREMLRTLAGGLRRKWRGALVVISGSLPLGVPPRFYRSMIAAAKSTGSRVFVDTSGDALRASLASRPAFVKPNLAELETLLGRRLNDQVGILDAASELIARGAESAAVSLSANGLVWIEQKNGPAWFAHSPRLKPISTVGCGDATVAGFALAAVQGMGGEAAIRLGTACGAANCLAKSPGRISPNHVKSLMPRIEVRRIG
jgi:1-phosphofructokinase family hexose kinase